MNSIVVKDVGILTNDPQMQKRMISICDEFHFSYEIWNDLDSFMEFSSSVKLLFAHFINPEGPIQPAEMGQLVRSFMTDPFLVCVSRVTLTKDESVFCQKSGCSLVVLEEELFKTGKPEFICTQILKSQYIPIKTSDLIQDREILFDIYHLLPMRGKFLKFAIDEETLDEKKITKSRTVGELYIHRKSSSRFKDYIFANSEHSPSGIEKRSRSQFLNLFSEYIELVYQLTSQSDHATFGDGQKMLSECANACKRLIETLGESGQAWKIINNSAIGEFGSAERAPAVAAYCGLFALLSGMDQIEQIMLAALLSDLGLILTPPAILKKIRDSKMNELSLEEREEYEKYPLKSMDLILSRKISIPEKQREWILATQEHFDGTGFPRKVSGNSIPMASRLIGFCREFDRRTLLMMGQRRPDPSEVLREMLLNSKECKLQFGDDLINALLPTLES